MASDESDEISTALEVLSRAFVAAKCRYLIGGSFASSMQGEFRATNDIDILTDLQPHGVPQFRQVLGDAFIVDDIALLAAAERRASCNIIHEPSFIKIDLFYSREEFHLQELERAVELALPSSGITVHVATPEDIILAKLAWYKKGGNVSDRQWRDILGVLRIQQQRLDRDYLSKWSAILNVESLLDTAIKDLESL